MNADYIVAALMITTAIVWPITGCLRELRERAEAERAAGEDQARWDFETPAPPFRPDPALVDNIEGNDRLRRKDRAAAIEQWRRSR
jgi:hypothetical protein